MLQYSDDNDQQTQQNLPPAEVAKASSIGRLLKNTITNLTYNLKHSNYLPTHLLRKKIQLSADSQPVYLLGQTYHFQRSEEFMNHFRDTVWLSYRKGIKNIGDDTGWGCMIRSAQMMLAQCIKRSMGLQSKEVLKYFADDQTDQLSLVNICKHGKIDNRWTTANQIVGNIKELVNQMEELQLEVHSINEGCLVLRDVILKIKNTKKSHLLVIHNRLGLKNLDQLHYPHLKQLMKLKQFAGILGGEPGQAMYILGYCGDQVIFLDPHYVQDSCSSDIKYFKNTPRGLEMSKLSACISMGFFVKEQKDMMDLIENLYLLEDYYRSHRAIDLLLDEQLKQQLQEITKRDRKISMDDFETIQ